MYRFLKLSRIPKKLALLSLLFRQLDVAKTYGSGWVPKKWYERSGVVLRWFKTRTFRIHRGKGWRRLKVFKWNVGFAWRAFARTTSLAIFKKKATSKKQKKKSLNAKAELRMSLKVQQIKDVKSGVRRRSVIRYDDPVTLAIQSS
jgi:ribosomal protein S19